MKNNFIISLIICLIPLSISAQYKLDDFLAYNPDLEAKTDSLFYTMNDSERIAQMIISSAGELGKPTNTVIKLTEDNIIGGAILMKGAVKEHKVLTDKLNAISKQRNNIPLLFSMDAEPSLFNGRARGAQKVPKTNQITTLEQCDSITQIIDRELLSMGIRHNFAPVLDISTKNAAITNRSYGDDKEHVIAMCNQFIVTSQFDQIVATAKHFPGHGLVVGDTHTGSVYIDGEMLEVDNYTPLIEQGVASVMVAHIIVKNNPKYSTDGIPASCSRKIVTDLLKNEMNFKGIVITDALNMMKAVTIIKDAPLLASKAGCDMLLMVEDERKTLDLILNEMKVDERYKLQVYESVKKILRLKICLGLVPN